MDKAKYGSYGVVEILGSEGSLSHIRASDDLEFWVKTSKLKPVHEIDEKEKAK